ncbi:MAG: hypothetical protein ABI891_06025 [Acidobacteriota bacterium]
MKKVLFFVFIFVFSLNIFAQSANFDLSNYGVSIEPDKRLIVVLASLEAAQTKDASGKEVAVIKTPLSEQGEQFRQQLQADLANLDENLRQRISNFVVQYKRRHPKASDAEILAPFISMAYTLTPAPDLAEPSRTEDLPGDLLEVLDYSPLVREFYRRSALNTKLDEYVKTYQSSGDDMRTSAKIMVGELLDYLHTKPQLSYIDRIKTESKSAKGKKTLQKTEVRERSRKFVIVPELLAPKGTINFINARDEYYAIVPPETDLASSEVRRAYLQYVFDPLVLKNAKDISTFSAGIKTLLNERRQENPNISPDVYLAVLRSLVAAADARQIEFEKTRNATAQARRKIDLMKTVDEKKAVSAELETFKRSLADETAVSLSEAYEKGAVLAFYFADQLKGSEDSGFDIESSLRDMILSLDTTKETNRLAQFADARKHGLAARNERRKMVETTPEIVENPVTKKLVGIDAIIKNKNYQEAEVQLKQLLQTSPKDSPRIYYSLGRNASLSAETINDAEARKIRLLEAKVFYENAIRSATPQTDKALLSLSYVAIGRIFEFYGDESAANIYQAAIKIGDVPGGAYNEALKARERLMKDQ